MPLDVVISYSTRRKFRRVIFHDKISEVKLSGKGITSIDLSPLRHLPYLEEVSLADNEIVTLYLVPLKFCKNLARLHLRKNKLKSIDLSPLRFCESLQLLDLEKNKLEMLDMTPLFECTQLLVFDIDRDVELVANSRYEEASVVPQGLSQFLDRITWVDVDEIMEFRLGRLRLVLELYELLRLDHLVELLRFPNTEALDIWLENIPDSVPLEIRGGEVIAHSSDIPDEVEQFFKVGRVLMELEPTTGEGESVDREHDPGVGVVYRRKLHEQSIFQLTKDALASYGIGRWRHAAIEGWTVIEALLSAEFERHYQRPKPIEMPYTKVIRHLRAHLPWDKFSEGMLLKSLKVRERIYPASPDPKPEEAEKIIAVALQLCQHLDVGLDELTPTGVSLLRVAATKPCPICIKPMRAGQRTARCPNCGEYYHLEHLMDYVKAKGYCPLCLKPLVIRRGGIEML